MSKFYKFNKAIQFHQAVDLLSSLTDQKVTAKDIQNLIDNKYLRPIIGRQFMIVGFDGDEINKIINGGRGQAAVFSDMGVAAKIGMSPEINGIPFSLAVALDTGGKGYLFACAAPGGVIGGEALLESYSAEDLLPLDPFLHENMSIMPGDIISVAEMANNAFQIAPPPNHENMLIEIKEGSPIAFVQGITGTNIHHSSDEQNKKIKMREPVIQEDPPSFRKAVGALLALLEKPRPTALNQSAIKSLILEQYGDIPGLSIRNLDTIFAAGNKSLERE